MEVVNRVLVSIDALGFETSLQVVGECLLPVLCQAKVVCQYLPVLGQAAGLLNLNRFPDVAMQLAAVGIEQTFVGHLAGQDVAEEVQQVPIGPLQDLSF